MNFTTAMIGVFMVLQIGIGLWAGKKFVKDTKDYNLAGQSVGMGLAMFSLFATWFGAETIMGSAAAVADEGLAGSRADPFGYTICLFLMGILVAFQLRKRNYTTIGDFYRDRFSQKAEFIVVLVMLPTSLFWAATQLLAFGQIISVVSDATLNQGLMVATAMIIVYTFAGGMWADIINDFLHGMILIVGLAALTWLVVNYAGGFDAAVASIKPEQLKLTGEDETLLSSFDQWLVPILGSLVAQEALGRLLATKSPQSARGACFLGGGLYLIIGVMPVFIALVATHFSIDLSHRDEFMPTLARELMPEWLFVIFIGALMSAILSTVDSTLLTFSTLTSVNLVFPYWKTATEKKRLLFNRFMTVIAGILALLIAFRGESIYDLAELSSSFGSAGLLVTFFAGLWLKRGGQWSAGAALLSGMAMSLLSNYVWEDMFEAPFMTSILVAAVVYLIGMTFEKKPTTAQLAVAD